jgi:hypothetical protein
MIILLGFPLMPVGIKNYFPNKHLLSYYERMSLSWLCSHGWNLRNRQNADLFLHSKTTKMHTGMIYGTRRQVPIKVHYMWHVITVVVNWNNRKCNSRSAWESQQLAKLVQLFSPRSPNTPFLVAKLIFLVLSTCLSSYHQLFLANTNIPIKKTSNKPACRDQIISLPSTHSSRNRHDQPIFATWFRIPQWIVCMSVSTWLSSNMAPLAPIDFSGPIYSCIRMK